VAGNRVEVTVRGDRRVLLALNRLPREARREVKDGSERLGRRMANTIRAAGRAEGRQAARASRTVRVARGEFPEIVAGPHPFLFGSEFGIKRRLGWYRKGRYWRSEARQYRGRTGGNPGYWFFPTYRAEQPAIRVAHQEMANAIIRAWDA
jgi:hypothetical protein